MSVALHCSRWARRYSNSSGKDESSATTLSGRPRCAIAAPMTSLLPTWPVVTMIPPTGDAARMRAISAGSIGSIERHDLVLRHVRHAHQLDEVGPVAPVRAQRDATHPRIVGRQPEDVPEVPVRPGALGRPEQVRGLRPEAQDGAGRPSGERPEQPGGEAVADDGRPLHDPRAGAPAPVRRLETPFAVGHRAAVATLALVPARRLTVFLTGASVPTSVSLSSPRMNASTRLNAMSSWIWMGGLFMK